MCSVLKCQWFGHSDAFAFNHYINPHTKLWFVSWASLKNLKMKELLKRHWNRHWHCLKTNSTSLMLNLKRTVLWYCSIWGFSISLCESVNSYVFRLIFNPNVGGFFLYNTALLLRGNAVTEPQCRIGIFLCRLLVNKVKRADVQGLWWPFQVQVSQPNPPVLLVSGKPIEIIPLRTGAVRLRERFVIITLLL